MNKEPQTITKGTVIMLGGYPFELLEDVKVYSETDVMMAKLRSSYPDNDLTNEFDEE